MQNVEKFEPLLQADNKKLFPIPIQVEIQNKYIDVIVMRKVGTTILLLYRFVVILRRKSRATLLFSCNYYLSCNQNQTQFPALI
jgi:hypothetical protein